jgi:replicative DNA helicase
MAAKQQIGQLELECQIFRLCNSDKSFAAKMIANLDKSFLANARLQKYTDFYKGVYALHNNPPTKEILEAEMLKLPVSDQEPIQKAMGAIYAVDAKIEEINKLYLLERIVTMAKKKRVSVAIEESDDIIRDGEYTDEKYQEIMTKLKDAIKYSLDTDIGVNILEVDTRYDRIKDALQDKIPSGFGHLDATALGGGFARKEIACFLAPPGVGKTIWLVNCGLNMLRAGYNVIHYSMEMSEERLGVRYDAIVSGISNNQLIKGMKPDVEKVKKSYIANKSTGKLGTLYLKEFPTGTASVIDLEAHLEELMSVEKAGYSPDVIIVDYGDIMKAAHKTNNTYEEQGWIFRELRALAIKYNCVVLTATQATRGSIEDGGGTKENVGMEKVADSMEKNRVLDLLFSIIQSKSDKTDGMMSLFIAKNRNGEANASFEFSIDYKVLRISEYGRTASKEEDLKNKHDVAATVAKVLQPIEEEEE